MQSSFNIVPDIPPDIYKSHLNIINSNNLRTIPLWPSKLSKNESFDTNSQREYYRIEILTNETEDEDILLVKKMDYILNVNKYLCHICNIEVPKMYIKEHKNSIKHKTCSDIANLALDRIKLQMQLDLPTSRKVEVVETYFCEPCSTVVFVTEKENHEKSITHKISLKHDEQLVSLYKIYSDIHNVQVNSETGEDVLIKESLTRESVEINGQNMQNDEANLEVVEEQLTNRSGKLKSTENELQNSYDEEEKSEIEDRLTNEINKLESIQLELNKLRNFEVNSTEDEMEMEMKSEELEPTKNNLQNVEVKSDIVEKGLTKESFKMGFNKKYLQFLENNKETLKTEENRLLFLNILQEYSEKVTSLLSNGGNTEVIENRNKNVRGELDSLRNVLQPLENLTNEFRIKVKNTLNMELPSGIDDKIECFKLQLATIEEANNNNLDCVTNSLIDKSVHSDDHKNDNFNKESAPSEIDKKLEFFKLQLENIEEAYSNNMDFKTNSLKDKPVHLERHRNCKFDKESVASRASKIARKKAHKKCRLQTKKECFSNGHALATEKEIKNNTNQNLVNEIPKHLNDTTNDPKDKNLQAVIKEKNYDKCETKNDIPLTIDNGTTVINVNNDSLTIKNDDLDKIKEFFSNEDNLPVIDEEKLKVEALVYDRDNWKQMNDKIDLVIAKYFHSTCTVDALNDIQENKNKNKQTGKEKIKKRKNRSRKNKQNVHEKEQIQNVEQNESLEENNNIKGVQQNEESTIEKLNKEKVESDENLDEVNKIDQPIEQPKSDEINKEKVVVAEKVVVTENVQKINKKQEKKKNKKQMRNNKTKKQKELLTSTKNQENNKNKEQTRNKKTKNKKGHVPTTKHQNLVSETNKPQKPTFNLVYYLKDISRRCETKRIHTVEAINDNIVQITAINGDKIRVVLNNFHSFHVKANNIFCKLCESTNVRRTEWHIIENEHRAKVMIAINDFNGIRKLDDIWSHCILCNDLTTNIDFHLETIIHKNKVKQCLFELGKTNSDDDTKQNKQQNRLNKGSEIANLMQQNHLILTEKNYLKCFVCDVIVNYNLTRVKHHIISFDHLNKLEQQQLLNNLVDLDDDAFYCIPCDVKVSKMDHISHCKGKRHKKMLQEFLIKNGEEVQVKPDDELVLETISQSVKKLEGGEMEDSKLICFVCNVIIYCIEEHTYTFEHKKMYCAYLECNKLNETEIDTFYCIPCNTVIKIDYLMTHCTSRKHRLKLNNLKGNGEEMIDTKPKVEVTPSTTEIKTEPHSADNKKLRLKVLYQFKEMTDPNKLTCTVCDEEIIYSRKEAEQHISTLDHTVAFNLMMLWNKIKKRDDKYFCDICCSDMTYFSEISHIYGNEHADNLAKEPKGTIYEYDGTLVTHAYAMALKVGDRFSVSNVFC